MSTASLRIFSYQPSPRLWKATIAARLADVTLEIRSDRPEALAGWLWDFDSRPLTAEERERGPETRTFGRVGFSGTPLHKTKAFLKAHPYGTVPAAFSPDGAVGIFESNSIARAVARLAPEPGRLYGDDPYEASRIDAFMDAGLRLGIETQPYLLELMNKTVSRAAHARAEQALEVFLGGIETTLSSGRETLVGSRLSLADICFVCELTMLWSEQGRLVHLAEAGLEPVLSSTTWQQAPEALGHYIRLRTHPAFAPDLEPYLSRFESRASGDQA
jgi:glutathione S-transferase